MARDPRFCKCGSRLVPRGAHFSRRLGYRRYKVCPGCGRTYTTSENLSQGVEKPTPPPS